MLTTFLYCHCQAMIMGDHCHSTSITRVHSVCYITQNILNLKMTTILAYLVLKSFLDLDGRGFYYTYWFRRLFFSSLYSGD